MSESHIFDIKQINGQFRLILKTTDFSTIANKLNKRLEQAPDFFAGAEIVIDAYGIVQPLPWKKLVALLEQYQLKVLGVHTNLRLSPTVLADGFAVIDLRKNPPPASETPQTEAAKPVETPPPPKATTEPKVPTKDTLIIDRHLRSGERIYAQQGDLIVVGNVGHGAEIIADGHIHVYGNLLGRAIAGAKGKQDARIFATHFAPQLVAIAGIYRLFDGDNAVELLKKTVMVSLHHESLTFDPLKS